MQSRTFIRQFFIILGILLLPILVNVLFVYRASENSRYNSIVELQQLRNAIYGPAFNGGSAVYRLELASRLDPVVAAVGSSRVMSFRKEFFSQRFANLGGVVANLDEGRNFANMLARNGLPKVILFGVDYWWMNQIAVKLEPSMDGNVLTFRKLTSPLLWLANGRIEPDLFADVMLGKRRGNPMTSIPAIGISAIKTMNGMRPDGSVHYGAQFFKPAELEKEASETWKAQQLDFRIRGGRSIEPRNIDMLRNLIGIMEGNGSHVVVFIPPVAPAIRNAIGRDPAANAYIAHFREALTAALGPRVHDFHDSVPGGDDDCEFVDGYHGGEITYLRLLKSMAASDSVLTSVVDMQAIDTGIAGFKGHAFAIVDGNAYTVKETDFLGIGCAK